jgi:hypothetical protein
MTSPSCRQSSILAPHCILKTTVTHVICVEIHPEIEVRFNPLRYDLRQIHKGAQVRRIGALKVPRLAAWQLQVEAQGCPATLSLPEMVLSAENNVAHASGTVCPPHDSAGGGILDPDQLNLS